MTTGGNVTKVEITPETYEKMNEEFEEEDMAFRIVIPTQEQIDDWRVHSVFKSQQLNSKGIHNEPTE